MRNEGLQKSLIGFCFLRISRSYIYCLTLSKPKKVPLPFHKNSQERCSVMICESYFHFILIYEGISHTFFCFQMTAFSRIVQNLAPNLRIGEKNNRKFWGWKGAGGVQNGGVVGMAGK